MAGVTGPGGAFVRADSPEALYAFFPRSSKYFPVSQPAMPTSRWMI